MTDQELNLEAVLKKSTEKLGAKYPEAQEFLLSLSAETLKCHLTPTQITAIAKTLIKKVDLNECTE
jgi:hypothetical protein